MVIVETQHDNSWKIYPDTDLRHDVRPQHGIGETEYSMTANKFKTKVYVNLMLKNNLNYAQIGSVWSQERTHGLVFITL